MISRKLMIQIKKQKPELPYLLKEDDIPGGPFTTKMSEPLFLHTKDGYIIARYTEVYDKTGQLHWRGYRDYLDSYPCNENDLYCCLKNGLESRLSMSHYITETEETLRFVKQFETSS